jgi:transposase
LASVNQENGYSQEEFISLREELRVVCDENAALLKELADTKELLSKKSTQCCIYKHEVDELHRLLAGTSPYTFSPNSSPSVPSYQTLLEELEQYKARVNEVSSSEDDNVKKIRELQALVESLTLSNESMAKSHESMRLALETAEKLNQELKIQLGKPTPNSGNSGLSPSNDITKGNKKGKTEENSPDEGEKRRRGGQKGHKPHFRTPFTESEATETYEYKLEDGCRCKDCETELEREPALDRQQDTIELPPVQILKIIHKTCAYKCPKCGKIHYAAPPKEVTKGGLFSPSLLVHVFMLKGLYLIPIRKIANYLKEFFNIDVSFSFINNLIKKFALYLRPVYLEIQDQVKEQKVLHIDETTFKLSGKKLYTWCFVGPNWIFFKVGSRQRTMLDDILGLDYEGIIICDCYGGYLSFAKLSGKIVLQLCIAHLKRDFKHCADFLTNEEVRVFGEKGLEYIKKLLSLYNDYKDAKKNGNPAAFEIYCTLARLQVEFIQFCLTAPQSDAKARGIGKRFEKVGHYYFTFVDNPDVDPTNNRAEREVRTPVLERKISYGAQSEYGKWCCEVIWTSGSILKLHNKDIKAYYDKVAEALYKGDPPPSLVNEGMPVDPKYVDQNKQEIKDLRKKIRAEKRKKEGVSPFKGSPTASENTPKCKKTAPKPATAQPVEDKRNPEPETATALPQEDIPWPIDLPEAAQPQEDIPKPIEQPEAAQPQEDIAKPKGKPEASQPQEDIAKPKDKPEAAQPQGDIPKPIEQPEAAQPQEDIAKPRDKPTAAQPQEDIAKPRDKPTAAQPQEDIPKPRDKPTAAQPQEDIPKPRDKPTVAQPQEDIPKPRDKPTAAKTQEDIPKPRDKPTAAKTQEDIPKPHKGKRKRNKPKPQKSGTKGSSVSKKRGNSALKKPKAIKEKCRQSVGKTHSPKAAKSTNESPKATVKASKAISRKPTVARSKTEAPGSRIHEGDFGACPKGSHSLPKCPKAALGKRVKVQSKGVQKTAKR